MHTRLRYLFTVSLLTVLFGGLCYAQSALPTAPLYEVPMEIPASEDIGLDDAPVINLHTPAPQNSSIPLIHKKASSPQVSAVRPFEESSKTDTAPKAIAQTTPFTMPIASGSLMHQDKQRRYLLYTPSTYRPTEKTPLILAFHGYKGSSFQMMQMTGLNELAEKEGFLVLYPNAIRTQWYTASGPSDMKDEDVTFIKALLQKIQGERNIDPQRIYATGFSNGGFFTQRLACEMSDQIAAFATVAATIGVPLTETCHPSRPIPIQIINGTDDPIILWKGQIRRVKYAFRDAKITSVPQAVHFWQQQNMCSPFPKEKLVVHTALNQTGAQLSEYPNCKSPSAVEQVILYKGGHTWPGSTYKVPIEHLIVGRQSMDIDANQVIWDFFKAHPLPQVASPSPDAG